MLFVAIAQHDPARCPLFDREMYELVSDSMAKVPDLEKRYNVKNLGTHILISLHKQVMVLEAPDYAAVESVLIESNYLAWNTVEIHQAVSPEEALNQSLQVLAS